MSIKTIMDAYASMINEAKMKLDPVGKADADIDNDGDVDNSDEYLHNRRKAIKKSMQKESEDEMTPCSKCDGSTDNHDPDCPMAAKSKDKKVDDAEKDDDMENESCDSKKRMKKESVSHKKWGFGEVLETSEDGYNIVFEHGVEFNIAKEDLHFFSEEKQVPASAAKAETWKSLRKGKGAEDMAKDTNADTPEMAADDSAGHEDATKAGRVTKQAPNRGNDQRKGDTKIVKPVSGSVSKTTGRE
jgi:hypothetical protein